MKRRFTKIGRVKGWLDLGWFADELFELFSISICQVSYCDKDIHFIALFALQVAKFRVAFGFHKPVFLPNHPLERNAFERSSKGETTRDGEL